MKVDQKEKKTFSVISKNAVERHAAAVRQLSNGTNGAMIYTYV